MLKALFVLEIITFLPWLFVYVEKRLDKKTTVNFKIYDITENYAQKLVRSCVKTRLFWNVATFTKIHCYCLLLFRSSHQTFSLKIDVLKIFAKFTGKHLCQCLSVSQGPKNLFQKRNSDTGIFLWILWNF